MPAEPPHLSGPVARLIRVADRDHLIAFLAGRQADDALVADPRADQRAGERRAPADPARRGVGFVVADDGQRAPVVVFVGELDGGAEADLVARSLRWRDRRPSPAFMIRGEMDRAAGRSRAAACLP